MKTRAENSRRRSTAKVPFCPRPTAFLRWVESSSLVCDDYFDDIDGKGLVSCAMAGLNGGRQLEGDREAKTRPSIARPSAPPTNRHWQWHGTGRMPPQGNTMTGL